MPSPLAHAVSGYVLAKVLPQPQSLGRSRRWLPFYGVFAATAADFDFIPQLLTGENYHRGLTHSLLFTLGFSAFGLILTRGKYRNRFGFTAILYSSHLLLDFFSAGRGIQLFYPLTSYWRSPVIIFPGIHYSEGIWNIKHLFPLFFELIYSALLVGGLWWWQNYSTSNKKKVSKSVTRF